ncbi:salicylate hydroxylase [Grosmannia clavigera kw1407]|uniref:Salicylate hydroxylase n=1 Tax=Grosmannia clavigera (strain kw1407 / UAMH 11150) TaxID=655863 RepID=F0XJ65_GROCL|nr:salicylate hydroxylase [Grosmannia clavigera kw1407]EFX02317.1 salicylate hydroxylase [Grosmannia clavigera kw1407]
MGFQDKRIAVIGGGLGGMAFANSARYAQLANVQLYESAGQLTEVGAGVNITRNANRILDAMGVGPDMLWRSSRDPPCYMEYRHYRTGAFLGQIDEFGAPRSRQIHRAHLLDALQRGVPDAQVSLGKRLVSLAWQPDVRAYRLCFADGSTAEADIVIGCDGIKSVVRRQHFGLSDAPAYSGQMVYRGYVAYEHLSPTTAALLRKTVNFRGPRRHILTLPIGNDDSATARVGIIAFMSEPLENWASESWLDTAPVDDLHDQVRDWTGAVQEIVAGLRRGSPDGRILKQALYVREPTATWFDVRPDSPDSGVFLIGDSVHSTLPHQGQGACQAIESGFALAQVLKSWPDADLGAALQYLQDLRKPRTDRITQSSYETGKMASADIPEDQWAAAFDPEVVRERMRWVMEYDLLGELAKTLPQPGDQSTAEDEKLGSASVTVC